MTRFLAWLMAAACAGVAQTQQFEVVSIKPSDPNVRGSKTRGNPAAVVMTNFTLKTLVASAWHVHSFQITGGPAWLDTARFDISAKVEKTPSSEEFEQMMQAMVRDRFHLAMHRETREMPVYALVLARSDRKLGPKMIETKQGSCVPVDAAHPPPAAEAGKQVHGCGFMTTGPNRFTAFGAPAKSLEVLTRSLGRVVIDKTGMTGKYDITLEWTPDEYQLSQWGEERDTASDSGPTIFSALEEQLGLKLVSSRGPVEMLVIEKAEKPTEN